MWPQLKVHWRVTFITRSSLFTSHFYGDVSILLNYRLTCCTSSPTDCLSRGAVLQDLQLVWQASLDRPPVNLTVAKFGEMSGIVCSLDENGMLCAWYQGTDPPTSSVLATETKEMDYEQINREHRQLLQVGVVKDQLQCMLLIVR